MYTIDSIVVCSIKFPNISIECYLWSLSLTPRFLLLPPTPYILLPFKRSLLLSFYCFFNKIDMSLVRTWWRWPGVGCYWFCWLWSFLCFPEKIPFPGVTFAQTLYLRQIWTYPSNLLQSLKEVTKSIKDPQPRCSCSAGVHSIIDTGKTRKYPQ